MTVWIDTHCHLNEEAFSPDLNEVVERAVAAGVRPMLVVGCTLASSRRAVELASQFPSLYAAVGIQPNYVAEAQPGDFVEIEELSRQPKVVAIGETGLDRYWDFAPIDLQREYFVRHIELSRARSLPFIVHCREAEADTVAVLREQAQQGPLQGVMHSFSGDLETARACWELGLYVSFAGMVTFKRNDSLRQVAKVVPADRILVETDSPYLLPSPVKNDKGPKRNEPAHVRYTANHLAEVRGVSQEEFAAQTTANARRLFPFDDVHLPG
ncbi:YchF/TatD family DNA exonuclease [bacterium]|nr:YchF/TatD family DNA exonuclease [bacterium]